MLQFLDQLPRSLQLAIAAGAGLLAVTTLSYFFWCQQRMRRMTGTPTSRIRSAAQGFVELKGTGRMLQGDPVIAPLTGQRCLWWEYSIVRQGEKADPARADTSDAIFELVDETGRCIIDPEQAQVITATNQTWYGDTEWPTRGPRAGHSRLTAQYRYHQRLLLNGQPLYAMGLLRTQRAADDHDERQALNGLLAEWKRDQVSLLKRFDANADGEIDMEEWEAARQAALEHIRDEQRERNTCPGLHVLSRPTDNHPFVLSAIPEQKMVRRYRYQSLACLVACPTTTALCAYLLLQLAH